MSPPVTAPLPSACSAMPPTPLRFGTIVSMSRSCSDHRSTPPPSTSVKNTPPRSSTRGPSTSWYPSASTSTSMTLLVLLVGIRRQVLELQVAEAHERGRDPAAHGAEVLVE